MGLDVVDARELEEALEGELPFAALIRRDGGRLEPALGPDRDLPQRERATLADLPQDLARDGGERDCRLLVDTPILPPDLGSDTPFLVKRLSCRRAQEAPLTLGTPVVMLLALEGTEC
jgi:hypothetical protein